MNKKIIILFCIIGCFNIFSGCKTSNEMKLQKNLSTYITNIEKNINQTYIPSYNDLNISAFTDIDDKVVATNANSEHWYNNLNRNNYIPRYSNTNQISGLNNYISKLERIYVQMNDSVCAVGELTELKDQVSVAINNLKNTTSNLKANKNNISEMQLLTSNELLKEAVKTSKSLQNNNLKEDINILKQNKNNLLQTSTISTKYIKIINALDSNITSMKNIYQSVVQINAVLNAENFENKVIDDNHYISSEVLNTPVTRDEYISQFEKENAEHFQNELLFITKNKKLSYTNENKDCLSVYKPYKRENLPFVNEEFDNKNKVEYL